MKIEKISLILILLILYSYINASPSLTQTSSPFEDGYRFAKSYSYELNKSFFTRTLFKIVTYRVVPSITWLVFSFTLGSHGAVDMIAATLVIPFNIGMILVDIPVIYTEMRKNQDDNLRHNVHYVLEKACVDQIYEKEFWKGVNRYLKDTGR